MNRDDFSPEIIRISAFFTGHRKVSNHEKPLICQKVSECISEAYESGYRRFWCGCALGFDTLAAFEIIRMKAFCPDIMLLLAIPCETQDSLWSVSDRTVYRRLMDSADEKRILSPVYYKGAMLARNRYMADRSSLCICWLKNMHGGTAYSVRYASRNDQIRIINLAVKDPYHAEQLRENSWNSMYISPSAKKSAVTVPLRLTHRRKRIIRNIQI